MDLFGSRDFSASGFLRQRFHLGVALPGVNASFRERVTFYIRRDTLRKIPP